MKIVAKSFQMKGDLDDNYTLYENGDVLHEYDKHRYPGGFNLERTIIANELKESVKVRLLEATPQENLDLAKRLMNIE